MFPDLSQNEKSVTPAMVVTVLLTVVRAMFVELLGAVGTFEFVALTGSTKESGCGKQQEKAFHRCAI